MGLTPAVCLLLWQSRGMRSRTAVLLAAGLVAAPAAHGSIWIANDAKRPRLAVDARGFARVTWVQGGVKKAVIVPPKGQLTHGGSLTGPDVSRPARFVHLPLALVVRSGPGGTLYALQQWQVQPGGPVELHLARWTAQPVLRLALGSGRLTGTAVFQGRPLTGFTTTLEGKRLRVYAYLDCFGCPAARHGWRRLLGLAPKADGTFTVRLRPAWTGRRYRATIPGPNAGSTYAPDIRAEIAVP
jgi:hypothetical protein